MMSVTTTCSQSAVPATIAPYILVIWDKAAVTLFTSVQRVSSPTNRTAASALMCCPRTCAVFTTRCRKANYCRLERAASTPTACDRTISAGLPPDIDKSLERRTVRHRRHGVPQHQMCKSIDARSPTDG